MIIKCLDIKVRPQKPVAHFTTHCNHGCQLPILTHNNLSELLWPLNEIMYISSFVWSLITTQINEIGLNLCAAGKDVHPIQKWEVVPSLESGLTYQGHLISELWQK